jgi:hypothetical protein
VYTATPCATSRPNDLIAAVVVLAISAGSPGSLCGNRSISRGRRRRSRRGRRLAPVWRLVFSVSVSSI